MRKLWNMIAILVFAVSPLVLARCTQQQPTQPGNIDIHVSNNNSNQNNIGGGTQSPAPGAAQCDPVQRVDIVAPTILHVGDTVTLDATPLAATGPRLDSCNTADGVAWGLVGPCDLSSTTTFNPILTARAAGTCAVSATVAGIASPTQVVVVQ